MPQLDDEYLTPAHVSMYLENNDAPHGIDVAYITNSLWDISQLIEKADEEERELSWALKTLQKRRTAMLQTQCKLQSIISPLCHFPTEILSEIFHHILEWDSYSVLNTDDGPWSLSHVNHHWRVTALTCSEALWSNLYIGIYDYCIHQRDPLSLLRTCLTWSCRHNISVHFDYPKLVLNFEDKAKEIAQLLLDNCERWQSLEISNNCLEIHSLLGKVHSHVPNLTNLVIHHGPVCASPIGAFELAPHLHTVKIYGSLGVVLGPRNPSLVSYKDYSTLSLTALDSYFTILRSCRQHLQTFTSLHSFTSWRLHAENPPIILPQLKHLRATNRDLIQSVMTPNLESFHLDNSHGLWKVLGTYMNAKCYTLNTTQTLSNCGSKGGMWYQVMTLCTVVNKFRVQWIWFV